MSSDIKLDAEIFHKRAKKFLLFFRDSPAELNGCDAVLSIVGASDGELSYQKSIALQNWWIGYEFPEMLTIIRRDKIVFLTSAKKAAILESLKLGDDQVPIEIYTRTKDEAQNRATYAKVLDLIPTGKVGIVQKENPSGKLVTEWNAAVSASGTKLDTVDITVALAVLMAGKDTDELLASSLASKLTSLSMKNYFIDYLTTCIDNGKKITHERLSELLENCHQDERKREKIKAPRETNWKLVEWCFPPIIQSGGKYDLKPSAESNTDNLHGGTVVCSFGVRYKSYCSSLGRTILINPEKEKENNYTFLLELQQHLMVLLQPGVACKEIYNSAVAFIEAKRPDLKDHFLKNCGFATGIEFRESSFVLSAKCDRELLDGMILNLSLGFQNLTCKASDPRNRVYALFLADSVHITKDGAVCLTDFEKDLESISYTFGDDDEEDDDSTKVSKKETILPTRGAILENQLRQNEDKADQENKRRTHQQDLFDKIQRDGLARYTKGKDSVVEDVVAVFKKFESYRAGTPFPKNVANLKIVVDRRAETVILPIYGQAVPFHLSTLKNVSKSDEGEFVMVRFNFLTPGQATGKKEPHAFEDEQSTFIRSLSYRSTDMYRLTEVAKEITDLKREIHKRETEKAEKAGLVDQEDLIEIKGRRPLRLPDVFVKPGLEGKRFSGDLEIHVNGLRYQSSISSSGRVDIPFSNIKHFFFQPCDGELIILLHIHLIHPIMIGKKKTSDVQIYREVTDASFDETGNRRRRANYGDEDELAQEQEERRHRAQLNKEFSLFSEKVTEASKKAVDIDIPVRDLGFQGVFHRQLVLLQPTTDCLVHLTDSPYLVVSLADVELAHLERVQFGLKNFDLVFIFKDYKRPVVHVNTIPVNQLENVKEWLDSVDVPFTEGPVNLSWVQIMKTISDDPKSFFEEAGGWTFLQPEGSDGSQVESSESEFEAESDASESSESDSDSDDGSDFSEESGSASEADGEEGDESGEDWDDLDRKAEMHDRKKRMREEEQDLGGGRAGFGKPKFRR